MINSMKIIRVRSPDGTDRFEVDENTPLSNVKAKIQEKYPKYTAFNLSKNADGSAPLNNSSSLKSLQVNHGDLLFLKPTGKVEETPSEAPQKEAEIIEDEIDTYLESQDGWIQRERDSKFCKHGPNARCTFCMPIAPWTILDLDPWKSEGLKFIPFHAYLRKMQSNMGPKTSEVQKSRSIDFPNYKMKECKKHPPYPQGICTECDPGTISLNAQSYRHVDHVEFESMQIVDSFIQFWRESGTQRCGYLYGKYVPDKSIPLGIRAVVMAIYEPPQQNSREEAVLEKKDPMEERVEALAKFLGLQRIGFMWTDLQVDQKTRKPIKNRNAILTGPEIIRMARMQNKYPSPCKFSMTGRAGSKFVSVIVTGNDKSEIELQVYQVSDQCMALGSAGLITYSKKDPAVMKAKKSSSKYIPDIIYRMVDKYGANVVGKADPTFPSDFFIIPITHGAPKDPKPFFKRFTFPIENRKVPQTAIAVKQQVEKSSLGDALSDYHLLVFLSTQFDANVLEKFTQFVVKKSNEGEVKAALTDYLKSVKPASPPPTPQALPGIRSATPPNPKEQGIINQLVQMGYSQTQAREAVWATGSAGVEQALDFLLRG